MHLGCHGELLLLIQDQEGYLFVGIIYLSKTARKSRGKRAGQTDILFNNAG